MDAIGRAMNPGRVREHEIEQERPRGAKAGAVRARARKRCKPYSLDEEDLDLIQDWKRRHGHPSDSAALRHMIRAAAGKEEA